MWQPVPRFVPPQGRQSIDRLAMVVSFLKGAKKLHPLRPPSVPPWDLEVVLRALSQPLFEPLTSVGLKELSLKTTLLLALASAKLIGDLHAYSVDSYCIRFGPGDCSVTLWLVYLGCRCLLANLHLSAVSLSYERLANVDWYRLPGASFTAGLNSVPITESFSVMFRESL